MRKPLIINGIDYNLELDKVLEYVKQVVIPIPIGSTPLEVIKLYKQIGTLIFAPRISFEDWKEEMKQQSSNNAW